MQYGRSQAPKPLAAILDDTAASGFQLSCDERTGCLLRTLAVSKPGGNFLELGTGTGVSAAWLLDGMDRDSRLISVDRDPEVQRIAARHLTNDHRCTFVGQDAAEFLASRSEPEFDLVFADAWPGKFTHLEAALALLDIGGFYIVDDLLPQPSWPVDHPPKVDALIANLEQNAGLELVKLDWSTGIIIAAKVRNSSA